MQAWCVTCVASHVGCWSCRPWFVVSEHIALLTDRDPHVPEGVTQIYDLLCACSCSGKLRTKGGGLNGTLFLGVPVDWHLVGKVEDARDRSPHDNVMVEVGVNEVRQGHMFKASPPAVVR